MTRTKTATLAAPLAALGMLAALALPLSASAQSVRPLVSGWNTVGSPSPSGIEVNEYVTAANDASECEVKAIWRFNSDQSWSAYFSNAPDLTEIERLEGQNGYLVFCD